MSPELVFERELGLRDKGPGVKRVQEWLNLHGYGLAIDGDFGRVSEDGVLRFQKAKRIKQTGRVDKRTFGALVAPMSAVLEKPLKKPKSFGVAMLTYAK